jgi:hypothetical protein
MNGVWMRTTFHYAKIENNKNEKQLLIHIRVVGGLAAHVTWISSAGGGQLASIIPLETNPTPPSHSVGGCIKPRPSCDNPFSCCADFIQHILQSLKGFSK